MKRFLTCLFGIMIIGCLVGCGTTYQEVTNSVESTEDVEKNMVANGYFTEIVAWSDEPHVYKIVYDNNTKVKYFVVIGPYCYAISPLYNADGSLQIYEETESTFIM